VAETGDADDESSQLCDCEMPGRFYSGVPGILACVVDGRLGLLGTLFVVVAVVRPGVGARRQGSREPPEPLAVLVAS